MTCINCEYTAENTPRICGECLTVIRDEAAQMAEALALTLGPPAEPPALTVCTGCTRQSMRAVEAEYDRDVAREAAFKAREDTRRAREERAAAWQRGWLEAMRATANKPGPYTMPPNPYPHGD